MPDPKDTYPLPCKQHADELAQIRKDLGHAPEFGRAGEGIAGQLHAIQQEVASLSGAVSSLRSAGNRIAWIVVAAVLASTAVGVASRIRFEPVAHGHEASLP